MTTHIYQKAEKGQDEVRTCVNHLDQRHRAVFLTVNGEKTCDDIFVQLQLLDMTQTVFDGLEGGGYIRPYLASSTTVKAVSTDEPAPAPASANAVPAVSSKEPATEDYQRLYRFYTETISWYLGLRGYLLEMKVERAGNAVKLVALCDALKVTLSKTCGEPETSNVTVQPDLLIDEATG